MHKGFYFSVECTHWLEVKKVYHTQHYKNTHVLISFVKLSYLLNLALVVDNSFLSKFFN